MGAIGTHIAKILCDGFGMKLIYNSKTEKESINIKYSTKMMSLNDVFKEADIISINATYTQENINMINKEQFEKMKQGAIIVNTARQELINKEDLYEYIIANKLCGVAIDGYYKEPITEDMNE